MPPPVRSRCCRRAVVTSALVGVLAAGVGCGRPAVLDVERAEARIATSLAETFEIDAPTVTCPDEVRIEAGSTFTCTARLDDDDELAVEVRQTDDEGALAVEPTRAVLITDRVEADIAEVLDDRFSRPEVEVVCPGGPRRLEEPDATFSCTAVDGDERKEVEVRVRDRQGALTYTLG